MSEEKSIRIVVDESGENLQNIITSSNQAKDMIVKSLKKGMNRKFTNLDVIEFLEDCHFDIKTNSDGHELVFNIPEKEK